MSQRYGVDVDIDDQLEDMIHDIGEDSFRKAHFYDILFSGKYVSLYKGCIIFTRLFVVLKLFNINVKSG